MKTGGRSGWGGGRGRGIWGGGKGKEAGEEEEEEEGEVVVGVVYSDFERILRIFLGFLWRVF